MRHALNKQIPALNSKGLRRLNNAIEPNGTKQIPALNSKGLRRAAHAGTRSSSSKQIPALNSKGLRHHVFIAGAATKQIPALNSKGLRLDGVFSLAHHQNKYQP